MKHAALLLLITICVSSRPKAAEVYHVAQGHPAASDDNSGAEDRPWKTISKAAAELQPGDAVMIHGGTYREYVRPARSGSVAEPITYMAAEGAEVVISGADVVTGWTHVRDGIWKREEWPYRFRTHPNNDFHRLIGRCEQVIADRKLLKQVASVSDLEPGTFCALPDEKNLYVRLKGDADPNDHLLEASVRPLCFGMRRSDEPVHHIRVQGLTIRHAANTAQRGALCAKGNDWLIEGCSAEWTNGTGVTFRGEQITIRRVRSHHNGQQGASGGGRGFLLDAVRLDHNNLKGFDKGWEAGAIKITHARDGIVRNCLAEANDGNGFWFDIDVRDVLVENCVARDNAHNGIFVEISGGFHIRNNLCVRNGLDGQWGRGGIGIAESDHCTIEHNTCVLNMTGIAIREQGPRSFSGIDGKQVSYHVHDLVIRNNICARNTLYQIGYWYDNPFFGPHPSSEEDTNRESYDPDGMSIRLDHNLYWCQEGQGLALFGVPWRSKHKKYRDLSEWQKDRGQDIHSIVGDPKFTDPEAGVWTVQDGSSAVRLNAGRL
jgi:parallel beta-helix repeat protein